MTHAEWFAASTPGPLLRALGLIRPNYPYGEPAPLPPRIERRSRLFCCACARMVWDLLPTDARNAVETRERYANGLASSTDLRASEFHSPWFGVTFQQHALTAVSDYPVNAAQGAARSIATRAAGPAPPTHSPKIAVWHATWQQAFDKACAVQACYLRDIFPPPEYSPVFDPGWSTSTVLALARQMHESGDYSTTPILADALQDAGCEDAVMLNCCRVPGEVHVRGNWVVDLVLGRE